MGGRRDPGEELVGWAWETEEERGRLWFVVLDREGDPKEEETVGWRRRRGSEDGTALLNFRVGQYISPGD